MDKEEWKYEYWFACIRKVRNKTKKKIRENMGSAKDIFNIEETTLKCFTEREEERYEILSGRKKWDLETRYEKLLVDRITFLPYFHPDYPKTLENLAIPPYALYLKGHVIPKNTVKAAIVGARHCSPYGEKMAIEFGEALAKCGIDIVSGMARGVDGAGHRGALNVGGRSYGILGSGVDICYPKEHIGLYVDLQEQGGLISEFPPGTPPLPQNFPARNRIISALADVILVMEAKEKSGSLITATCALEQGKMVYAIPGAVNDALSRGCHKLIYDGAGIAYSPEILLDEWGLSVKKKTNLSEKSKLGLATDLDLVYSCLDLRPKNLDHIIRKTGFSPGKTAGILGQLILMGLVKETGRQYYIRLE